MAAHSPNYNFSIWHIALKGVADPGIISRATFESEESRESTTTRLVLKHLRARGHQTAFEALLRSSRLDAPPLDHYPPKSPVPTIERPAQRPFEHPIVTQLFQAIIKGDWDAAENCLERSAAAGSGDPWLKEKNSLFAAFVSKCTQRAQWTRLHGTDADGDVPSPRGGHQLVVDSVRGIAYLFGGWDGQRDLSDFWAYDIAQARWRRISPDTSKQGGPGPRSCHKMAYSSRSGLLYILGRYVDYDGHQTTTPSASSGATGSEFPTNASSSTPLSVFRGGQRPVNSSRDVHGAQSSPQSPEAAAPEQAAVEGNMSDSQMAGDIQVRAAPDKTPSPAPPACINYLSDFFRFATRSERWDRLSFDTTADGGPKLIFDHQMVVDDEAQILYVFGGRVAHWDPSHFELSGMWRYDCIQRVWSFDFDDETMTNKIPSRVGHSMLLDIGRVGEKRRQLWIMAGQRGDSYLADMYTYDLDTKIVREISSDYSRSGKGPEPGFTQRAAIDPNKREIYLFSGLIKRTKSTVEKMTSAFWLYRIERNEWSVIWQGKEGTSGAGNIATRRLSNKGGGSSDRRMLDNYEGDSDEEVEAAGSQDETERSGSQFRTDVGDEEMRGPLASSIMPSSASPVRKQRRQEREPRPRYASELGYEQSSETFFLFGGNPADPQASPARLDDLWSLKLLRPDVQEILRRAKFTLRQQRFREMAAVVPRPRLSGPGSVSGSSGGSGEGSFAAMEALIYLQTKISEVVDHNIPEESRTFRKLVTGLLRGDAGGGCADGNPQSAAAATLSEGGQPARDSSQLSPVESDGLPAVDDDADMLSISQTLPNAPSNSATDLSRSRPLDPSQRPPALFAQRLDLFRNLLHFFPPESIEPTEDLSTAISSSMVRMGNRR